MGQKSRGWHLELVICPLRLPLGGEASSQQQRETANGKGIRAAHPAAHPRPSWLRKARSAITRYLTPRRPRQPQLVHATGPATSGGMILEQRSVDTRHVQPGAKWGLACQCSPSSPDLTPPDHPSGSWAPSSQPIIITTILPHTVHHTGSTVGLSRPS